MKKWLIIGLGNPEAKYFQTYHNVGFLCVDKLAQTLSLAFSKKGNMLITTLKTKGQHVLIAKPLTYMNRSGEVVVFLARKHKIAPENIVVIYDDLYIDRGKVRINVGGSGAGHNGVGSINQLLGYKNYIKIKLGIKPEKPPHTASGYVLSKITDPDRELLDVSIDQAVQAVQLLLEGQRLEIVQGRFNCKNAK